MAIRSKNVVKFMFWLLKVAEEEVMTIFISNQERIQNKMKNVTCISVFCVSDGVMIGEDIESKIVWIWMFFSGNSCTFLILNYCSKFVITFPTPL